MLANNELSAKVSLCVSHQRPMRMLRNWLVDDTKDQEDADYRVSLIRQCGIACGVDIDILGNWDRLAHSFACTAATDPFLQDWFYEKSCFINIGKLENLEKVMDDVFGKKFLGNRFISPSHLDDNFMPTVYSSSI